MVKDTWLAYAPVKNNPEDAAKATEVPNVLKRGYCRPSDFRVHSGDCIHHLPTLFFCRQLLAAQFGGGN
ncbi:hypothetical protein Peur_050814 [Populus x canadensis]